MAPLKTGGTRLEHVPNHSIYVECRCGHSRSVPIKPILDRDPAPATVGQAIAAMRCSSCKMKQITDYRIVFVGGSAVASLGNHHEGGDWAREIE